MSPQTTSDLDDLSIREKLEYAVDQTRLKLGMAAARHGRKKSEHRVRGMFARAFPQWLRTTVVVLIEMTAAMSWLAATSNSTQIAGALPVAVLHPVAVAMAAHVWPTRTPPWRTLVWTWLLSWLVASVLYMVWDIQWALYPAVATIIVITAARCNANARRLWNWLVNKRIERTFGEGSSLRPAPINLPSASDRYARRAHQDSTTNEPGEGKTANPGKARRGVVTTASK